MAKAKKKDIEGSAPIKVKWSFVYPDNHIAIEVLRQEEDDRIVEGIKWGMSELLYVPGEGKDIYINLTQLRFVLREDLEKVPALPPQEVKPEVGQQGGN